MRGRPRGRLRVGVRRPAAPAAGAGGRAGRRGDHLALHVLRHRRGDLADRRPAGLRRHRARHLQHRPGPDRSGRHPADQGRHPRPPLRPGRRHGPDQRRRRPARPVRPGRRRPGDRRGVPGASGPAGSATPRRSASTRRRTSAGSATPGWSRPTTPSSPGRWPGSGSTGWSRSTTTTRSASTRGSTPSRPPSSASSSATSTPGPRPAARPPAATARSSARPGSTARSPCPSSATGHFHVYNQFVVRVPADARDPLRAHLAARRVGTEIYYPIPLHLQPCFAVARPPPRRLPRLRGRRRPRRSPCRCTPS